MKRQQLQSASAPPVDVVNFLREIPAREGGASIGYGECGARNLERGPARGSEIGFDRDPVGLQRRSDMRVRGQAQVHPYVQPSRSFEQGRQKEAGVGLAPTGERTNERNIAE